MDRRFASLRRVNYQRFGAACIFAVRLFASSNGGRASCVSLRLGRRRDDEEYSAYGERVRCLYSRINAVSFREVALIQRRFSIIHWAAVVFRHHPMVRHAALSGLRLFVYLTDNVDAGNWMATGGFDGSVTIYKSTHQFEDFEWSPYFWNRSHAAMITHCR